MLSMILIRSGLRNSRRRMRLKFGIGLQIQCSLTSLKHGAFIARFTCIEEAKPRTSLDIHVLQNQMLSKTLAFAYKKDSRMYIYKSNLRLPEKLYLGPLRQVRLVSSKPSKVFVGVGRKDLQARCLRTETVRRHYRQRRWKSPNPTPI